MESCSPWCLTYFTFDPTAKLMRGTFVIHLGYEYVLIPLMFL